jgi:hypothetical protein
VLEKLAARRLDAGGYEALHAPGFVRGLARGDHFQLESTRPGAFRVTWHSGNLAVRVYSRVSAALFDPVLTPMVAQLEGRRDILAERVLAYSLPLAAGFDNIETLFDEALDGNPDAQWSYGNVYDVNSGEPLNWWRKPNEPPES